MSGPVLLYFPDDLLARVDALVESQRKFYLRDLTKKEARQANQLVISKGKQAAEAYISSIDRVKKKGGPGGASRTRTLIELIELGLKYYKPDRKGAKGGG